MVNLITPLSPLSLPHTSALGNQRVVVNVVRNTCYHNLLRHCQETQELSVLHSEFITRAREQGLKRASANSKTLLKKKKTDPNKIFIKNKQEVEEAYRFNKKTLK